MKKTKIFSVLFAGLLCCTGLLTACKKDGPQSSKPQNPVTETVEHPYSGGLHKINVTMTDEIMISEGKTDYVIVTPESEDEFTKRAANLVRKHLSGATGVTVQIVDDRQAFSQDKKWIVLGSDKLFKEANLSMPSDNIGETGYYIKTVGKSVFVAAKSGYGLVNGALGFLSAAIGYKMFADDTVVYSAGDTVKLPDCDIIDKPDYEFYLSSNKISTDGATGMRFQGSGDVFIPVGGEPWHNSFKYLNPSVHAAAHPNWFSADKKQLCYTAGGEEGALDEMLDEFMKTMTASVEAYPNVKNITITIEDVNTACRCEGCQKLYDKYGTDSAAVVIFCNAVSERLEKYFADKVAGTDQAPREVNILFFAYYKTTQPPVKEVNGQYVAIDDEVKCRDNVGVYIAPISAAYNASFYDEANRYTAEIVKGWGALSNKLYMWLYETNYSHYLYPLNSYDTMLETYRFCKNNNAIFMFPEGQYNQGNVTAFGKLKEYFNSKALWDVNVDYSKICDDFFNAYFRSAAKPMRRYFEELQLQLKHIETTYPEIGGSIYDNMAQARFWPKRMLDQWLGYIDEAYALAEPIKASDPAFYDALIKHIDLESIFIRYALATLHSGSYSSQTLAQMREGLKNDCTALNITMYSEKTSLSDIFLSWN